MKKCWLCKQYKNKELFHKDRTRPMGLGAKCKECSNKYLVGKNFRKYQWEKQHRDEIRTESIKLLGGKCIRCNFNDVRALQFDHINGGGNKNKKTINRRYELYVLEQIRNHSGIFQLLCANCNWIKKAENNESKVSLRLK